MYRSTNLAFLGAPLSTSSLIRPLAYRSPRHTLSPRTTHTPIPQRATTSHTVCRQQPPSNPLPALPPAASSAALVASPTTLPAPPTEKWHRARRVALLVLRSFAPLALFALSRAAPALALGGSVATRLSSLGGDPAGFVSGLATSFILVLASEIGDKTFFISALLSMKYSRVLVLIGTMLALGAMTVISVGIGQIFHALPTSFNSSIPFDDYAAVALLLWFGYQNIRDGLTMSSDEDEELQDAKEVVEGQPVKAASGVRVVAETSSLIFLAEWGDKSMLATVALAAAKSPFGVIVGGISGHLIASIIAVVGGSFLGKFISEKNARLVGGVLFVVFAFLTIFGIY